MEVVIVGQMDNAKKAASRVTGVLHARITASSMPLHVLHVTSGQERSVQRVHQDYSQKMSPPPVQLPAIPDVPVACTDLRTVKRVRTENTI